MYLPFLKYHLIFYRDIQKYYDKHFKGYRSISKYRKNSKTTRLHLPKSYLTIHSNNPAALSSGNSTSKRKALVLTGLKFTVQAAPLSTG